MSEWIPIEQKAPPTDNPFLVTAERSHIYLVSVVGYGDPLPPGIIAWMPMPRAYIKPQPIFEVPKDGYTYLCWVHKDGFSLVYWSIALGRYHVPYTDGPASIAEDSIVRYMDEKGAWHGRQ